MASRLFKLSRRAAWIALVTAFLAYVTGYLLVSSFGGEVRFEPVGGLTVIIDYSLLRVFHYVIIPFLGIVAIVLHVAPFIYSRAVRLKIRNLSGKVVGEAVVAAFVVGGLLLAFKVAVLGLDFASPPQKSPTATVPGIAASSETYSSGIDAAFKEGLSGGSSYGTILTWDVVARHNSRDSCWIVVGGKVYDVTDYINYHPAGAKPILDYCGKDATQVFAKYHSRRAWELLQRFYIGDLGGSITSIPQSPQQAEGQRIQQPLQPYIAGEYEDHVDYDEHEDDSGYEEYEERGVEEVEIYEEG